SPMRWDSGNRFWNQRSSLPKPLGQRISPPATSAGAPGPGRTIPMIPAETSITPRSLGSDSARPAGAAAAGVGSTDGASADGCAGLGAGSGCGGSWLMPIFSGRSVERTSSGRAGVTPLEVREEPLHLPDPLLVESGGDSLQPVLGLAE